MKCKYCGEEMVELEYVNLGYGVRGLDYDCPNNCDLIEWLDQQNELTKKENEDDKSELLFRKRKEGYYD